MTTVAIVYHSTGGYTEVLAEAVAEGAASCAGTEAVLHPIQGSDITEGRWVNETVLAALDASDAIVFGSPTHMGSVSSQFKAFLDGSLHRWYARRWIDKIGAAFTVSSSPSGDKATALLASYVCAMQHGMIWVGVEQSPINKEGLNRLGFYTGVGAQADYAADGPALMSGDRQTGVELGARVARIAGMLAAQST